MHLITFYLATGVIIVLLAVCAVLVIRARSQMVRVLALDTFTLVQVSLLGLLAYHQQAVFYLDAALMLSLLSFVGTLAAARYYRDGELF
jgi:multicomponent Na+:H+ antiporter subunit F